ncbi:XRE family transcriptional regulator [Leptospira bourretii]|uniref:XRE family transcriptional regulator n=1 Tax=Leptospira bourretii TaxID=2484962 RepID=A0A4R9IHK6_9LEPT|nr:XRE family transcriptional regulator [Leptospira bourretii]TGK88610.1 XRE family transcriptional regulator [Leptospira bourretii]TGL20555.1 XRE family transcriptional regulator [Leptospira bourretii]TGL26852.1 XRE family transcriptional regulator [Leptospira bourretii]
MQKNLGNKLDQLIGKAIRENRKKSNISVETLSIATTLSKSSIVQIERGDQSTPIHNIYKIAEVLSVEISELLPSMVEYRKLKSAPVDNVSLNRVSSEELTTVMDFLSTYKKEPKSARKKKS